ncbi:MAG: hypothetical protein ACRC1H_10650 [Caldilineaceae bacterium]
MTLAQKPEHAKRTGRRSGRASSERKSRSVLRLPEQYEAAALEYASLLAPIPELEFLYVLEAPEAPEFQVVGHILAPNARNAVYDAQIELGSRFPDLLLAFRLIDRKNAHYAPGATGQLFSLPLNREPQTNL